MSFVGHIDRSAFEKTLRETFEHIAPEFTTTPALLCQARSAEVQIQFALWVADELNAGIEADVLLDAGARVIGGMVENFARGFSGDGGQDMVATILARVHWATTDDSDDAVFEVRRPTTRGGRA